jgi:hypothetical protein
MEQDFSAHVAVLQEEFERCAAATAACLARGACPCRQPCCSHPALRLPCSRLTRVGRLDWRACVPPCSEHAEIAASHTRAVKELQDMASAMHTQFSEAEGESRQEYEGVREEVGGWVGCSHRPGWGRGGGG